MINPSPNEFEYGNIMPETVMLKARLWNWGIKDVHDLMDYSEKMGWITRPRIPQRPWQQKEPE